MTEKRELKKDTYYHIYNRGNTKSRIFFNERDLERFGQTISRYLKEFPNIRIHVWSFLPNHFHLLLSEVSPDSTTTRQIPSPDSAEEISQFMRKIQQSHARYLAVKYGENKERGHKGPVFEGRFQAKEISDDEYLAKVAYYIRHNAIKHKIVDEIRDWPWAGVNETPGFPQLDYGGLDPEFDAGFE